MARMTAEEFGAFKERVAEIPVIRAEDMSDRSDRTLLSGYTAQWSGFHVYMKDEVIHSHVWHRGTAPPNDHSFPDGVGMPFLTTCAALYPEQCDGEFLQAMRSAAPDDFARLSFAKYNEAVPEAQFYADLSMEHELGHILQPA